jgi:hypothetical protein
MPHDVVVVVVVVVVVKAYWWSHSEGSRWRPMSRFPTVADMRLGLRNSGAVELDLRESV